MNLDPLVARFDNFPNPCSNQKNRMSTLSKHLVVLGLALTLALPVARAQSLEQALDAPGLAWIATNSTGGAPWTGTTAVTHDGVDSARTGTPAFNELSYLVTTLTNSGTLTFWARAEVTGGSYVNAALGFIGYRILNPEWRAFHYEVPGGTNTLFFVLWNRDTTGVAGDAGWVDEVKFADYTGQPPQFIEPPSDLTVGEGNGASLRSIVVGHKPFTSYWISSSTTNVYTGGQSSELVRSFYPVSPADAGTWRLVVSNQFGGITSTNFTLTVTSTPPYSLYLTESLGTGMNPLPLATNAHIELNVSAQGTPPFFYQWKHAGTNLPGAVSSQLDLSPFNAAKAGEYICVVTNAIGRAESATLTLEMSPDRPIILTQPLPLTLSAGEDLNLWADVGGGLPLAYQWFKDDVALVGEQQSSLYRSPAALGDTGYYQLQITNGNGSVRSDRVLVTVGDAVPTGDALEASALPWWSENQCSPGLAGWYGQTNVTHDGVDALASEPMVFDGFCEQTVLAKISGTGTLSFWWKIDGAAADELRAEVLDSASNVLASVTRSGSEGPDWANTNLTVTTGGIFIRWTLASGDGNDSLLPQAWLDEVQTGVSDSALDYALNEPGLLWLTGSQDPLSGNLNDGWFAQTNVSYDGIAAAQSPALQPFGSGWLQTTLMGPAVLDEKVFVRGDSDALLEFTLDGEPVPFGRVGGEPGPVTFYTSFFVIPPGAHTARWELKAGAQATNNAAAWLDSIRLYTDVTAIPGQEDLASALDNSSYAWLAYLWTVATNGMFTGGTAVKTPYMPGSGGAPLDTAMVGPAAIEFDWWVDTQPSNYFRFLIDDSEVQAITGGSGKQHVRAAFNSGNHYLRWIYQKEFPGSAGADAAWLDNVVVTPVTNRPPVATNDVVTRFTDQVILSVTNLLLLNDSDPDWFSVIRLFSHDANSTNGGTVTLQAGWLTYTPLQGFSGRDEFSYTISDGFGGFATAKVAIRPENPRQIPPTGNVLLLWQAGTRPVLRFHGTPSLTYRIEGRDALSTGSWQLVAIRTAGPDGTIDAVDPVADPNRQRFYRTVQQ